MSDRGDDSELGTSQAQSQEFPSSSPNELQNNEDLLEATVDSINVPNGCENCEQFENKIQRLKQQIVDMKTSHSVELLKMEEKLLAQKESSKKHVKEKKSLKNLLVYHKNKQLKLQELISSLHEENLISNAAASDLNVILKCSKYIHMIDSFLYVLIIIIAPKSMCVYFICFCHVICSLLSTLL